MIYASNIDSNNFESFIEDENVRLIYVKASWCGPCKMLSPIVEEVANEKGPELVLGYIDADEQMDFVKSMNVRNIPTLLFYKKGELKERTTGLKTKSEIINILQSLSSN